jgi:hypothetical protein
MSESSVKEWLRRARVTDGPEGDLIADMRSDAAVPGLFPNIGAMREYLQSRHACRREAIAAVPAVWRRYSRWLAHHPWRGEETSNGI